MSFFTWLLAVAQASSSKPTSVIGQVCIFILKLSFSGEFADIQISKSRGIFNDKRILIGVLVSGPLRFSFCSLLLLRRLLSPSLASPVTTPHPVQHSIGFDFIGHKSTVWTTNAD